MTKKLTKKQQFYVEISNIVKANAVRPTNKDTIEHIDKEIASFLKTQTILKRTPKKNDISDVIYATFLNMKLNDEKFIKCASSIEDLISKLENYFNGLMAYGTCKYPSSISDILEPKDFVIEKNLIPRVKRAYYNSFPQQKRKNDLLEQIVGLTKIQKITYDEDIEKIIEAKEKQLKELTNNFNIEEIARLEIVEKFINKIEAGEKNEK